MPDWHNSEQDKFRIEFVNYEGFGVGAYGVLCTGLPVFASEALCLKAIELMGDDLYTLFNIPKP